MDVIGWCGTNFIIREVGKVEVGYADSGAVAPIITLSDYGGFVEIFEYIVRYY